MEARPVKSPTAFWLGDIAGMVVKIAVITGWDRSGSTILANILGSTPGVITLGEINNVWERGFGDDLMCSCEQRFSRCELWRPIAEGAFGVDLSGVAARANRKSSTSFSAMTRSRVMCVAYPVCALPAGKAAPND